MQIRGNHFFDAQGRRLVLRGVNLGGSSKIPCRPDGRTHLAEGFYEGAHVSFVGRPFPLEEADEHFARLARWGQRFIRFLVTWEAIEHEGPGIYDTAYLDYVEALVEIAARHGISLFIDPHQDVWSRWTGGDGAPLWTLEALGFEPRNFQASGAALLHQEAGGAYPRMQWFSNHLRLACATMFTLFFGGNDFAPGITIEGEPVQEYLQGHYAAAMRELAGRLAAYPNVVGFDSINEPGEGFIGIADVRARREGPDLPGLAPTPWEAMLAGEGIPVKVATIGVRGLGLKVTGMKPFGAPGVRAWKDGSVCIWRRVGLWDMEGDIPILKKPTWFADQLGNSAGVQTRSVMGAQVGRAAGRGPGEAFNEFYLKPFIVRFAQAVRGAANAAQRYAIFVEGVSNKKTPEWKHELPADLVNATHWYDALTLTMKLWTGFLAYDSENGRAIIGPRAVRSYFKDALARIAEHSRLRMGGVPTLVGEFGLPFDMNGRRAFRTGDYRLQEKVLSAYYDALDANLLDATLWNYTAGNTHAWGDGWNGEDLSVFCADERPRPGERPRADEYAGSGAGHPGTTHGESAADEADLGGRALRGFVRPYAMATAGEILEMSFNYRTGEFRLRYRPDPAVSAPTEVFVPRIQYPNGFSIETEGVMAAERQDDGLSESADGWMRGATPNVHAAQRDDPFVLELRPKPGATECVLVIRSDVNE